jgi:hypothetical protein
LNLEDLQEEIKVSQREFRARAREVLFAAYQFADQVSSAIGTISVDEAYDGWADHVRELLKGNK